MARYDTSIEIDAPVELVWTLTQSAERRPEWDGRVQWVELLNAETQKKGTVMRTLGSTWGRPFYFDLETVVFEPCRRCAVVLVGSKGMPFVKGGGTWKYEELGESRCRFRATQNFNAKNSLFGRIADKLFYQPYLERTTEQSLIRLKKVAEADAKQGQTSRGEALG
ncbi:SRPBCC family protein [Cohnella candidum]|uniref:SRPBCC family protein n=1 Tax=Cohnella candidum TaxID=2674991 RepID=A0A3G3K018_9BACL|nr:SRPBCC family protein [Cohnella candidum]AYQ73471.1 SRPBCC family protein [Cohnella candidum]